MRAAPDGTLKEDLSEKVTCDPRWDKNQPEKIKASRLHIKRTEINHRRAGVPSSGTRLRKLPASFKGGEEIWFTFTLSPCFKSKGITTRQRAFSDLT